MNELSTQPTNNLLRPHNWVDLYADYLFAFALKRLTDETLAQDLVQDTFLAALEKAGDFKGESSERTWLTAILKYKIIEVYRKRSRLGSGHLNNEAVKETEFFEPETNHWQQQHWPQEFKADGNDPLHNKEFNMVLQNCLKKLPPLWFSVFTRKHMDEDNTKVICEDLNISAANFWVVIHRAKVNLRACMQKNWI